MIKKQRITCLAERSLSLIKKSIVCILMLALFGCNSEDASDCFQTSGKMVQQTVEVSNFERILVNRNVEVILKEAPDYKVTIETGANLLNEVTAEVFDGVLVLTDTNTCNYVRDYSSTKIYIDAPNITEINTSSQFTISSDGVLNYETLTLISENYNTGNPFTIGDFELSLNSKSIVVVSNNLSFFYLEGNVENLSVQFFAGAGRFEGENLIAQNVSIYHRGSNDMLVNPIQSLTGELRSVGDLISVNKPPEVTINQIYTGQLIFQ